MICQHGGRARSRPARSGPRRTAGYRGAAPGGGHRTRPAHRRPARIPDRACRAPGSEIALGRVPVGQRAEILRRRPDVIAAERKLAAATADTGTATAELFPKLTLSASAGFRALGGKDLFSDNSQRGALGPLIAWRIFDGGRVRAEIRAAEARQHAAAIGYEKAVLTALSDAEKALDQYAHTLQALAAQEQALGSSTRLTDILRQRHALGDVSLTELLDAERERSDQQATLAQLKTSAGTDLVALYQGAGGWVGGAAVGLRLDVVVSGITLRQKLSGDAAWGLAIMTLMRPSEYSAESVVYRSAVMETVI
ncbi:MAG: TolC family protein [Uliginosibacterium sp.]|nr:TolC family protein [Uliginosibacterium sp.]